MSKSHFFDKLEIREMLTKLTHDLQAAESNTIRWNSTHCPICRTQLGLPEVLKAEPLAAFLRIENQLGYCLECGLSPREVKEKDISQWVWVKIPTSIELTGLIGSHIAQAQGATLGEVIEDLDLRYPNFKKRLWLNHPNAQPHISLLVNKTTTYNLQELDAKIEAGDFVQIYIRGLA